MQKNWSLIVVKRDSIFSGSEKIFSGTNPMFSFIQALVFVSEKLTSATKTPFSGIEKILSVSKMSFFAAETIFSAADKDPHPAPLRGADLSQRERVSTIESSGAATHL